MFSTKYFFDGLDSNRWFGQNFDDYVLFGYIGDKEKYVTKLQEKSTIIKIFEAILPTFKLSSLIKMLIDIDINENKSGPNVFEKVYEKIQEDKYNKTITEHLKSIYKKGKKAGTYFSSIDKFSSGHVLSRAKNNELEGKLITIEGHLIHKSAIIQYNPILASQLSKANFEWILSDFPPQGLIMKNERFNGQVVILSEDEGFTKAFGDYLPFNVSIGYYPYVIISGFYTSSKLSIDGASSLSIVLTEYKPPKNLNGVIRDVSNFIKREINSKIYLDDREDLILFAYLAPILFKKANIESSNFSEIDFSNLLKEYKNEVSNDMPAKLVDFYDDLK